MHYDIIGDIHGEYDTLVSLLTELSYEEKAGVWQHTDRKVIFLGDFIDRAPKQKAVLDLVMPMVKAGHALAVMGNHEFNALAFHTQTLDGRAWLRPRNNKNIKQHIAFLNDYLGKPELLEEALEFFWSLPMWLELDGLRIIHASWDQAIIDRLNEQHAGPALTPELLALASTKGTTEYDDVETLLKGKELPLPEGRSFNDKDGNRREAIRVKWWDKDAVSYQDAYLGPEAARSSIPNQPTNGAHLIEYANESPPVVLGHYWMTGELAPLASNVACVDYSVAREGGKLVAYQWQGEQTLIPEHFVSVDRMAG